MPSIAPRNASRLRARAPERAAHPGFRRQPVGLHSQHQQLQRQGGKLKAKNIKKTMEKAARDMDFMEAARLRDEMFAMKKKLDNLSA